MLAAGITKGNMNKGALFTTGFFLKNRDVYFSRH